DFRGKWLFFGLILITHMLPLPVRIVPTFELITRLGWADTYWALTVPFFASATGTLLFRQFFLTVPHALADAARIDGAGPMRFLVSILLPLSRTNLAALFMVEFIYAWNEYLWPLVATSSDRMRVVQIGIKTLLASEAQAAEWNVVMAGAMISIVPPLLVLLLLQGAFVKGFALQQEKGGGTMTYRGFIFDLDGTIYRGERLIPGADRAVAELRRRGLRVVFVTNKPLSSRAEYAAKLTRLGIPTPVEDVISSSFVMARY